MFKKIALAFASHRSSLVLLAPPEAIACLLVVRNIACMVGDVLSKPSFHLTLSSGFVVCMKASRFVAALSTLIWLQFLDL